MITEADRVYDLDVFQVWNRLKLESDCPKRVKDVVKWGVKIKIEIHELMNVKPKGKQGKFLYKGKVYSSEQIWEEVDAREIEGKKWLIEQLGMKPIAESR